jgi:hypothetical protein
VSFVPGSNASCWPAAIEIPGPGRAHCFLKGSRQDRVKRKSRLNYIQRSVALRIRRDGRV